jgi:hypothetical protein
MFRRRFPPFPTLAHLDRGRVFSGSILEEKPMLIVVIFFFFDEKRSSAHVIPK